MGISRWHGTIITLKIINLQNTNIQLEYWTLVFVDQITKKASVQIYVPAISKCWAKTILLSLKHGVSVLWRILTGNAGMLFILKLLE